VLRVSISGPDLNATEKITGKTLALVHVRRRRARALDPV
jgi:hypothetical protein